MTARTHIHLHVRNLEHSTEFYRRFFGAEPVKTAPGYAKFLPEIAPLNLALSESEGGGARESASHFGFELATTEAVLAARRRVGGAGLDILDEMGVNCCHANQDKFWVRDPDGVRWEVYRVNYDLS
jgi:catechol 2,3-dioxygenase-like lactoylglutathione lyase family enzyme